MDTATPATASTTVTFLLEGDYGPFTVRRTVTIPLDPGLPADEALEAAEDEAFRATGIGTDLEAAGWEVDFDGDGADWEITRVA